MVEENNTNRKYKDSVFTILYSNKDKLAELFNALEGTEYTENDIEIVTLSQVLYNAFKNEVGFVVDGRFIILYEHQSTINDNMPLRMLIYLAREYEKIINIRSVYHKKLVKIPTPELYVFYNGKEPYPREKVLRLSDAYE